MNQPSQPTLNQTAPLRLPKKYHGQTAAYFYDKNIWIKQGIESGWYEVEQKEKKQ